MPKNKIKNFRQLVLVTLLGFHTFSTNLAFSADEPLGEIVVTGEVGALQQPVTGVAAKAVQDFPGAVTVLDNKDVEELRPLSTIDALQRVPGVNVTTEDGRGLRPNIGLRGLDPDRSREGVLLLADGIPIQPALYGDRSAYYNVPVSLVDRIEIIKGGSAALYGPSNIGGVVNFITKRPPTESGSEWMLGETFRDGGLFDSMASYAVTGDNGVGTRISYNNKTGQTLRHNTGLDLNDLNIRTIVPTDADGEVSFRLNYYTEHAETPGGLTPDLFNADAKQSVRSDDLFEGDRISLDVNVVQPLSADVTLDTILYTNFFSRDWYIADGVDGVAKTNQQFLRDFVVVGVEPRIKVGDWVFGTRLHHEGLDDINRSGTSADARDGLTVADNDLSTSAFAGYVQGDLHLTDKFTLTPGIRFEYIDQTRETGLRIDPLLGPVGGTHGSSVTEDVAGGLQYSYEATENGNFYGGWQRTFEPPTFSEAIDPTTGTDNDLDGETANSYEVGYRTQLADHTVVDADFFVLDFDNKIVNEAGKLVNGGETRHHGFELALQNQASEQVELNLGLAIIDAEFNGGLNDGKDVPMSPESRLSWGATYKPVDPLSLRIDGYFVDEQFTDAVNTEDETVDGNKGILPAYNIWNLRAEYQIPCPIVKDLRLYAGVSNIFDEEYRERRQASFNGIIPGLTRTGYIGFQAKF